MQTSKVAVSGGFIILIGGLLLAAYTATTTPALQDAKAKGVAKYSNLVKEAIENKDTSKALKLAKKALIVDPSNKEALESYKSAILASSGGTVAVSTTTQEQPKEAPKKPEAEADDEMGCI